MENCKTKHEHQGHLCVLAGDGQFDKIERMVNKPRFICFNCGRVAHADKNLCNPMPLKEKA